MVGTHNTAGTRIMTVVGLVLISAAGTHAWAADDPIDFNREIRPILSDVCYKCHGPDENQRQADFRLDTEEGAFAKLESGQVAIKPGDGSASELIRRVNSTDDDVRMPPPDSGKSLSESQKTLLRKWIDSGAPWRGHWSFIKPERPELPEVQAADQAPTEIDRFVLHRLESDGLSFSPSAARSTLIRRVTLDLTGLPPSPAEIDAFLADDSEQAYDKLVDRLLASKQYGEQMARYWLDAARYGDTHGLHLDNERSIWPYRDWVINAFNDNKPFDEFTVEQLAGDLLPNPTRDQLIATGFNRCNVSTSEGGVIDEEFRVRYAVDRVETTGTVWLGLSVGCAVCHEHKFDPISQKEFYQLFAYFNNVADKGRDGNALLPPPVLQVPTAEQAREQTELTAKRNSLQEQLNAALAAVALTYTDTRANSALPADDVRREHVWIEDAVPPGASLNTSGNGPAGWLFVSQPTHPVHSGTTSTVRTSDGMGQHFFTQAAQPLRVGAGDRLFAYVYLDPKNPPQEIMLQFNDGSWDHRAAWGEDLIDWGESDKSSRQLMGPLPEPGKWVRLEVDAAHVGLKAGASVGGWAFTQHGGTVYWDRAGIVSTLPQDGSQFDSYRVWERMSRILKGAGLPKPIGELVQKPMGERSDEQEKQLRDHYLRHVYAKTQETFAPLNKRVAEAEQQLAELNKAIPSTLILRDNENSRPAYVLVRGQYDQHGEEVQHGVPAALGPALPDKSPANRMALARWLVSSEHPLTARVTVNRFWQQYFGTGIVATTEDFGSQGEWPSHPGLLDWLAVEFIESGWDVKHLQKLIVTSATYRQQSHVSAEMVERDPQNRQLARGPRFRMDAEMVRDLALDVSGLLVRTVGGRSVKPYQPAGIWEAVGYTTSNTAKFKRDTGSKLYRRGLYTFWKRTAPPPSMQTFDAPSREACTVRRSRTNTPLQALVLMNDEQYVEAARNLAERMMRDGGQTASDRISYAFRLATGRNPAKEEMAVLLDVYQAHHAEFEGNQEAARKLLEVGESGYDDSLNVSELAALTMIGSLILNLDETVTKG
jgi:hypothetical protein